MTYEAAFAIASVLITLEVVYNFCRQNRVSDYQGRMFLLLAVDNGITGLAVVFLWLSHLVLDPYPVWVAYLFTQIYFITHILVVLFMFMYLYGTVKIWRELGHFSRLAILTPVTLYLLLLLSAPATRLIYEIDEQGVYHRGRFLYIGYICFLYYSFLIFYVLVRYRRSFSAKRRGMILLVMGLGFLSTLIQYVLPEMKVEVCMESVCSVILFLFIQNPSEQIDAELNMLTRSAFNERMKYNLLARKRFDIVGLLLPDLQDIDHRYGNEKSLKLLRNIGRYLSSLDSNIELYRIEKNCFALEVIQPRPGEVGEMIRGIEKRFKNSWTAEDEEINITPRLLRIILPSEITDDTILQGVMNRFARSRNENRVMMTSDFDLDAIKRNREINAALVRAMEKKNFEFRFTPAYSFALERIVSAEISLRFFDEDLGYVYDDELFRFAERSGHVQQLGELIFDRACRFLSEQDASKLGIRCLAVRLHPAMCLQYRLMDRLQEIIAKYGVDTNQIVLLLSEYTVSTATPRFKESINALEQQGVRFCLEDYGSGFTSISSSFELPFSFMRINRSVIRSALGNEKARITMDSTLTMARELNLMTVVEGIDDENVFRMIKDMACDLARGNYFYEQLQEEEFLKLLQELSGTEGGEGA
ncbi:MAG: EAL domain-containing protein [Lachnospiraceae bacterium]|nr:EAL domain-containing protein [Lachnospiraceae bacterium]